MSYQVTFNVVSDTSNQQFTIDYVAASQEDAEWMRQQIEFALNAVKNGATVSTGWGERK